MQIVWIHFGDKQNLHKQTNPIYNNNYLNNFVYEEVHQSFYILYSRFRNSLLFKYSIFAICLS